MLFGHPWPAARRLAPGNALFSTLPLTVFFLVLTLSGTAGLEAQEIGADVDGMMSQVESIELWVRPDGVEVEILANGPLKWSIRDSADGALILRLRDCRPGSEVSGLWPDEGLVESVEIGAFGTAENPETRLSIRTRQKIKYRIAESERSLSVLLISREPVVEAEPSPTVAEPSPTPAEPPPPPSVFVPPADSPTVVATDLEPPPRPQAVSTPEPFVARAGEYLIGPGDVLAIDVFGLDEMDRKVRVQRDGKISLPLLGVFSVADLDLAAAELLIAEMLRDKRLVRDPQVSIFVEELVSRAINVQGAVVKPGVYQLIGSKSLLELIGEAGGIREDSGARVLVLRADAGEERKIDLDLQALIAGEDRSLNIPLLPGDIVMVPFSRQLTVYVTGAVEQPGPVPFQSSEGITVLQAIIAAGGPSPRANLKKVHLLRRSPDGSQQKIPVNIKKIQNGKMDDVVLERNDTVVVGEWFF